MIDAIRKSLKLRFQKVKGIAMRSQQDQELPKLKLKNLKDLNLQKAIPIL